MPHHRAALIDRLSRHRRGAYEERERLSFESIINKIGVGREQGKISMGEISRKRVSITFSSNGSVTPDFDVCSSTPLAHFASDRHP
jgi:hypothetical protein